MEGALPITIESLTGQLDSSQAFCHRALVDFASDPLLARTVDQGIEESILVIDDLNIRSVAVQQLSYIISDLIQLVQHSIHAGIHAAGATKNLRGELGEAEQRMDPEVYRFLLGAFPDLRTVIIGTTVAIADQHYMSRDITPQHQETLVHSIAIATDHLLSTGELLPSSGISEAIASGIEPTCQEALSAIHFFRPAADPWRRLAQQLELQDRAAQPTRAKKAPEEGSFTQRLFVAFEQETQERLKRALSETTELRDQFELIRITLFEELNQRSNSGNERLTSSIVEQFNEPFYLLTRMSTYFDAEGQHPLAFIEQVISMLSQLQSMRDSQQDLPQRTGFFLTIVSYELMRELRDLVNQWTHGETLFINVPEDFQLMFAHEQADYIIRLDSIIQELFPHDRRPNLLLCIPGVDRMYIWEQLPHWLPAIRENGSDFLRESFEQSFIDTCVIAVEHLRDSSFIPEDVESVDSFGALVVHAMNVLESVLDEVHVAVQDGFATREQFETWIEQLLPYGLEDRDIRSLVNRAGKRKDEPILRTELLAVQAHIANRLTHWVARTPQGDANIDRLARLYLEQRIQGSM